MIQFVMKTDGGSCSTHAGVFPQPPADLRAQFVTLLGPPLTPEPVSSPVVGKPNGWNRCHSGFFWTLRKPGGDIFTR